jgi:hypothetical protein
MSPTAPFRGDRVIQTRTLHITAPVERVFPLICPIREAEWAEGWSAKVLFAESGVAEENGVYTTQHAGEEDALWLVSHLDPATHWIEFVYLMPRRQIVKLGIWLHPRPDGTTDLEVQYVRTGITPEGNAQLQAPAAAERFRAMMDDWEQSLNHYLRTGRMLKGGHH